jgi:hypothetical protein
MGEPGSKRDFGKVDIEGETDQAFGELDWAAPGCEPTPPPPASHAAQTREVEIAVMVEEAVDECDVTRVAPSTTSIPPGRELTSLTDRQRIPRVLLRPEEIANLPIEHHAGFLLGFIDGMHTMEEILDVCAMPPGEALDLIRSLVDMGVIAIE